MRSGSARGEAGQVPAAPADEGVGAPVRAGRRARVPGGGFATPLAATFLGLLVVQGFRPAAAAAPDGAEEPGGGPGEGGPATLTGERAPPAGLGSVPVPPAAAVAPGSILAAGSVIDPLALTRLAGEARFAEAPAPPVAAAGVGQPPDLPAAPGAAGPVELAPGAALDLALPQAPDLAAPEPVPTGDEDLANLGAHVRGGSEDQTLELTDKDDVFLGGEGDETVAGLGGDDQLAGGGGDDVLDGGAGDDRLDGGAGDDSLVGGTGGDRLTGGSGDDRLTGGAGWDRLDGGTGDDVLLLDDPLDAVKELGVGIGQGGADTIVVADGYAAALAKALPGFSPDGRATFVLGTPDPATFPQGLAPYRQQIDPDIENIRLEGAAAHDAVGSAGANVIEGNLGANRLHGGAGDDLIYGDAGHDLLHGGEGDDWLDGGAGSDLLYGGAGDDIFVLGLHEASDRIFDHEGRNHLHLSTPDPDAVTVELRGGDLVVMANGRELATVHDYAAHADRFAGIDLGEGVRSFEELLGRQDAGHAAAARDWLEGFLPEGAAGEITVAGLGATPGGRAPASASGLLDLAVPDLAGEAWLSAESVFAAVSDPGGPLAESEVRPEERPGGA